MKTAPVTGSTSNIGKAIAEVLARDGYHVVVTSRHEAEARAVATQIAGSRSEATSFREVDFADAAAIDALFAFVREKFGRLDALVNSVAYTKNESILDCDLATWQTTIDTNLRSYFLCTKAAAELMKTHGGGAIVNITVSSTRGTKDKLSYMVSKGGINYLTMCAAIDLAPFGIRVNAVGSGLVGTAVGHRDYANRPRDNARVPLGHIGEPIDVAEAVAFLVSDRAKYTVGAMFAVDGGLVRMANGLGLTIREVAEKTGITTHMLRYYERIGLVQAVPRARSGHRRYGEDELRWLELLKKLHATDMPIRRMLEYARLARRGDSTIEARRALLDAHRVDVEPKLVHLTETLATITRKLASYDRALGVVASGGKPPALALSR